MQSSSINCSQGFTAAVCIKNLCKSYSNSENGKEVVLNKFCMRVEKGSIYGFLGASGCGKTTVLSCIVGLKKWDSGQVLVFGNEPGSKTSRILSQTLGYMPQDLALHNQLSIMETMKFYGKLYNMPESVIMTRWNMLSELLNLSSSVSKLIKNLSGGQKRRASLAVALIHSPQLIVLDEPTVGLDPVLRENIWNHLYQIARKFGTTIIVTTHYIEEARYSDVVGIMRQGRMLTEGSPTELRKHYKSDLLEHVVMQICRLDQVESRLTCETTKKRKATTKQSEKLKFKASWRFKKSQIGISDDLEGDFRVLPSDAIEKGCHENQNIRNASEPFYLDFFQSMQKTFALTWVNFLIFIRHPVFLILIAIVPALQGTITLWAVGSKPTGLPLGIVNHEIGDWFTECESTQNHTFSDNKVNDICQLSSNIEFKSLSCLYLSHLKNDELVDLIVFNTEDEARVQVELGKSWGYMIIRENFSQSFSDILLAKQYATNESIEGSRIRIYLDYSQFISSSFIIRNIFISYSNYMIELAKSCSIDEKMIDVPLNFRTPIYGDNEDNYTTFVMPGVLLFSIFGIVSSLTAMLLIGDRRQGILSRATVAGLSCSNVILSHTIVQAVLTIAQLAIWNIAIYFIFSIPFNGQLWLYVLICLLTGLSGSAFGMFVGLIVSTEVQALYTGAFLVNVLLVYGGIIWPSEAMTQFWQTLACILPTYLPTQSLRSVIVRGVGMRHPLVWPGIVASVVLTAGFVVINALLYRKKI